MQSEMADFVPGAPTWWTGLNMCRLWFWSICSIMWEHDVVTKPEVHNILHYHQRRTEIRLQVTRTESLVCIVLFLCDTSYSLKLVDSSLQLVWNVWCRIQITKQQWMASNRCRHCLQALQQQSSVTGGSSVCWVFVCFLDEFDSRC